MLFVLWESPALHTASVLSDMIDIRSLLLGELWAMPGFYGAPYFSL